MSVTTDNRRVLLAARPADLEEMRKLFCESSLERWDILEAESLERAHFLLQHNSCDVLLVDESIFQADGGAGLAWVMRHAEPPTILLAGSDPEMMTLAYQQGVSMCLPRRITLCHAPMLAAALGRMGQVAQMQHAQKRTSERLFKCRHQIDRLVNLLWRSIPIDTAHQWFTHRHVLERLREEVARCGRHGDVLTVAVGEVENDQAASKVDGHGLDLAEWTSKLVSKAKRRCDVAGFYGMRGFMLLMVQTPQAGGLTCCRRLQTYLHDAAQNPEGPRAPIRASFGLSSFSPDNATSESLLCRAEKNLQAARQGLEAGVVAR